MIEYREGNLLEDNVEALVNTVNCVGVMGKGIALQFKVAFPSNYDQYVQACRAHEVKPGRMFIVRNDSLLNPKYIINFPTKQHWKQKSNIRYIREGLRSLVQTVTSLGITSIAIPPLGCGYGGLAWDEVRPMIEEAFADLENVVVHLYVPQPVPHAAEFPVTPQRGNTSDAPRSRNSS